MTPAEKEHEQQLFKNSSRVRAHIAEEIAKAVEEKQDILLIKELNTEALKKLIRLGQEELFLRRNTSPKGKQMPRTREDLELNQTEQGHYEEWLEDQKHDDRMLNDFDCYWNSTITVGDVKAIAHVAELLDRISKTYNNIGFDELKEML